MTKVITWIFDNIIWTIMLMAIFLVLFTCQFVGFITLEVVKAFGRLVWFTARQPRLPTLLGGILIVSIIAGVPGRFYQLYQNETAKTQALNQDISSIQKQSQKLLDENTKLKDQNDKLKTLAGISPKDKIALKVKQYFPNDYKTALMVILHESGLNPRAQGWNCQYFGISTACLPWDRGNAWSVDCGVMQNNLPYKNCPEWSYNVDWGLKTGQEKYQRRGWSPWVAYNSGRYLSHESEAMDIIQRQQEYLALGVLEW